MQILLLLRRFQKFDLESDCQNKESWNEIVNL